MLIQEYPQLPSCFITATDTDAGDVQLFAGWCLAVETYDIAGDDREDGCSGGACFNEGSTGELGIGWDFHGWMVVAWVWGASEIVVGYLAGR